MDSGVAFQLGPLAVRWYGLLISTGVISGYIVAYYRTKARGQDPEHISNILMIGLVAAIISARLYYVAFSFNSYRGNLAEIFAIWHGGLSFYGGLIVGLIGLGAWARRRRVSFGLAADLVAPAAAAGQAIGHIGCLIGGDSYGLPSDGPLAVIYRLPGAMAPKGVPLHPTQLYEAVSLGILALALWASRGRLEQIGPGATAAVYLLGNAGVRFALFFLRDDVVVLAGLKVAQLIAIGIGLAGVAWLLALRHRPAPVPVVPQPAP